MTISIITTTYNSSSTIRDTMNSVLRQTYQDIEYIVKDGGSTDGTVEILKEYEPKFHGRMKWMSEKDSGIYDGMNKGIEMATGDVIGILNSDDWLTSPNVISTMAKSFADNVDAVYGDVHFAKHKDTTKNARYYSGKIFRPWLIKFGFIPPHPSFYVRRTLLERWGCYDASYKISADFELIARLCYVHKIRTKYVHLDFVTMRLGGASTQNLQARHIGTMEDIRACKELHIRTNRLMISCKYIIKIVSALLIRH